MSEFVVEDHVQGKHMILNMGPQHPSTHGVLRLVLELDGERVIKCVPHIGYLHTGIEKLSEHHNYTQNITHYCRMDYLAPLFNELAYCLAVEQIIGEEVPARADYIRVMLSEMTRISSHLVWIGSHAIDLGAGTVLLYAFGEREKILDFYESVGGQRMMTSYFRIGGVRDDLPEGTLERVKDWGTRCLKTIELINGLLTKNPIFRARTENVGIISRETALSYGLMGPLLRAIGVDEDLRRDQPYCRYNEFQFDIPVLQAGDVYSRYLVRLEEMRQAVRIVQQCVDKIKQTKPGTYMWQTANYTPPKRENIDRDIEGLIHHFKYWTEGIKPPPGEAYGAVESGKGELGFYVVSDGSAHPVRVKVRGASFVNLAALPAMCEGRLLADVVACIGSIDIVLGEVDR